MAVFCSSSSTQDKGAGVGDGTAHLRIHELNELLNMLVALLVPSKEDPRQGGGGGGGAGPSPPCMGGYLASGPGWLFTSRNDEAGTARGLSRRPSVCVVAVRSPTSSRERAGGGAPVGSGRGSLGNGAR